MTSGPDMEHNLQYLAQEVAKLAKQGAQLISSPENALLFATSADYHRHAEPLGEGKMQQGFSALAKQWQCWLHIGSFPIRCQHGVTTTSLLYTPTGERQLHYDKLHMFDVDVADGHKRYRESETFAPGNELALSTLPFGTVGLTICYDLRFPALFQCLQERGANIILVPAAFTAVTGQAHWEPLLRARAIENQVWIIAVDQTGTHPCGRETHGHSMVISPWGEVVLQLGQKPQSAWVDIALEQTEQIRQSMPVSEHSRFVSKLKEEPNK